MRLVSVLLLVGASGCSSLERFADRQQRLHRYQCALRALDALPKAATRAQLYAALPPLVKPKPPLGFSIISGSAFAQESYPVDEDFQVVAAFNYRSAHLYRHLRSQSTDDLLFGPTHRYTRQDQSPDDLILGSRPYIESRKNGPNDIPL